MSAGFSSAATASRSSALRERARSMSCAQASAKARSKFRKSNTCRPRASSRSSSRAKKPFRPSSGPRIRSMSSRAARFFSPSPRSGRRLSRPSNFGHTSERTYDFSAAACCASSPSGRLRDAANHANDEACPAGRLPRRTSSAPAMDASCMFSASCVCRTAPAVSGLPLCMSSSSGARTAPSCAA